jgi:hypothetical protein
MDNKKLVAVAFAAAVGFAATQQLTEKLSELSAPPQSFQDDERRRNINLLLELEGAALAGKLASDALEDEPGRRER